MPRPFRARDVFGGAGIALWLLGMALVLGVEDLSLQAIGAVLWALGLTAAAAAAAVVLVRRDPYLE